MRVLIAQDNTNVRRLMVDHLRRAGHEVQEALTGPQAWDLWERQPFPCVLLEAALPDAEIVAQRIRQTQNAPYTYIIFLNAKEARLADDHLPKPFNPEELMARVRLGERLATLENRLSEALAKPASGEVRDLLTGLYNRKHFEERLEDEFQRALRYQRALTMVIVDIDHFKNYNESQGHAVGDNLLRELTTLILSIVRRTDFVARYGGEEYAIILPETVKSNAMLLAENLRDTVAAYPFPGRETQPNGALTISLGVANYPDDATDSATLLRAADAALYRAKRRGRNKVMDAVPLPDLA